MSRPLRILTWHVHGNYMYYLSQVPHEFYLVADADRTPHHGGRCGTLPWGDNVHDAPVERLRDMAFDVVLFQSREAYEQEQHTLLSEAQRRLPRIYLEHDPPQQHPTNTRHWVQDGETLLVHCTPFNALMWDSGRTSVRVIEHGVKPVRQIPDNHPAADTRVTPDKLRIGTIGKEIDQLIEINRLFHLRGAAGYRGDIVMNADG